MKKKNKKIPQKKQGSSRSSASSSTAAGAELAPSLGQSLERNEQRVEVVDGASWKSLLDDVSHVDLWDGVRRHERPGWKDWLDAADKLTAQPRTPLPPVSTE